MGRVWLGHDRRLQRTVALKEPLDGPDGLAARMLWREAALTARMEHPGVVQVFDVIPGDDGPIFVMERVDGSPLDALLEVADTDAATRALLLDRLVEVCATVAHAHRLGLVHCDLKPSNLMIPREGHARVLDWGLATALQPLPGLPEAPADRGGTAGWMAPERDGAAAPRPAWDVWSLGAMLHRVVWGQGVEAGESARARVSPDLAAIVRRACEGEPGRRYPDAAALHHDLVNWRAGRRVAAMHYPAWRLALRLMVQWRAPLSAALLAVVGAMTGLAWNTRLARQAEARALDALARAEAEEGVARQARAHAETQEARARSAVADQLTERAREALERRDTAQALTLAREALTLGPHPDAAGVVALAAAMPMLPILDRLPIPDHCLDAHPGPEWGTLFCLAYDHLERWDQGLRTWQTDLEIPQDLRPEPQPDGALHLHVLNGRNELVVVDAHTGTPVRVDTRPGPFVDPARAHALLLDGSGLRDGTPPVVPCDGRTEVMIRLADGGWLATCGTEGAWERRPDGRRVHHPFFAGESLSVLLARGSSSPLVGTTSGRIAPLDASQPGHLLGGPVRGLLAIPGTPWLAVWDELGAAQILDHDRLTWVATLPERFRRLWVRQGQGEGTGVRLVGVMGRTLTLLAVPASLPRWRQESAHGLASLALAPDGVVWTTDGGGGLTRIPPGLPGVVQRETPLQAVAKSVAVAHDGSAVWMSGIDAWGMRRVEDPAALDPTVASWGTAPRSVRRLALPAGDQAVWIDYGPGLRTLPRNQPPTVDQPGVPLWGDDTFTDLDMAPSGRCLLAVGTRVVRLCAPIQGPVPPLEAWAAEVLAEGTWRTGAVGDDGRAVAVGPEGARRWDGWRPGEAPTERPMTWVPEGTVLDVLLVGRRLVAGDIEGRVTVWDIDTGDLLARWQAHRGRVSALEALGDGSVVVSAGWDGAVQWAAPRLDPLP
jgi:hypothetical protein